MVDMTTIDTIREKSGLHRVDAIPGYDGYYVATDEQGRVEVWSGKKTTVRINGTAHPIYHKIFMFRCDGKLFPTTLARACCLAWHGEPKPGRVAHSTDGFYHAPKPTTIKWVTRVFIARMFHSRLEHEDRKRIWTLYRNGRPQKTIARDLNLPYGTIRSVLRSAA